MISKPKKSDINIDLEQAQIARKYIDNFWVNLERYNPQDQDTLIGLPNLYLVPAHDPNSSFNFDEMYYWDSYFMVQGLLHDLSKKELVLGMLDNLFSMLQRFQIIPNASRTYLMGRSQPPLLTSFIFDVYEAYGMDKRWLEQAILFAKKEYETVWLADKKPHWRNVHEGLSRYYDINMLHDLAEAESGWDMTSRFNRRCLDFLPIDLNAMLYKYEIDFARAAELLEKNEEQQVWLKKATQRKAAIDKLMWDDKAGLYFDYDYKNKKRSKVISMATYVPLWAGMVSKEQAEKLVKSLSRLECPGGYAATSSQRISFKKEIAMQWTHPNGWAPLHFFLNQGLELYGYRQEARNVALLWLQSNLSWFQRHGVFLEKYNVAMPDKMPDEGLYPTQIGFGWTNAIFECFCHVYIDQNKKIDQ